jgi:hypothetical protein
MEFGQYEIKGVDFAVAVLRRRAAKNLLCVKRAKEPRRGSGQLPPITRRGNSKSDENSRAGTRRTTAPLGFVIPAKGGIQATSAGKQTWIPAGAGMTVAEQPY